MFVPRIIGLALFTLLLSSNVRAEIPCPCRELIEENVATFSAAEEGKITLDGQTWNFETNLTTPDIKYAQNLNREIADVDFHTCNYIIYQVDSRLEDASLLLHQRPLTRF